MVRPRSAAEEFLAQITARNQARPPARPGLAPVRRKPALRATPLVPPARESRAAQFDRGLSATILLVALFVGIILLPAHAGGSWLGPLVDRCGESLRGPRSHPAPGAAGGAREAVAASEPRAEEAASPGTTADWLFRGAR
ncbi:MAG: hypothetical protein ACT4PV_00355 [Planctomycetaceae bacterium]